MHYLMILGRQPELGLMELESLLGADAIEPFGRDTAIINQELDLGRMGGSQKLGRIIYRGPARDLNEAPLDMDALPLGGSKTSFGLSYYGQQVSQKFVLAAGLTLKKRLKARGSIRFVAPQNGRQLSAAQVKFNALTRNGFELLVAVSKREMVVAVTEQIQDIDWYATRDYQRPTRSAKVGMLPPKLAQIMVNTTTAPLICDPFCGTGVVLQEALLLGRAATGSDISPEMVQATRDNLTWLNTKRPDLPAWRAEEADARQVKLPTEDLAIVSEGYLGQNLSKRADAKTLTRLHQELMQLYSDSLRNWSSQLDSGAEVSITVPVWQSAKGWQPLPLIDHLTDLGYTLRSFALVNSRNLIYRRPNQFVGRQLLILRKA